MRLHKAGLQVLTLDLGCVCEWGDPGGRGSFPARASSITTQPGSSGPSGPSTGQGSCCGGNAACVHP